MLNAEAIINESVLHVKRAFCIYFLYIVSQYNILWRHLDHSNLYLHQAITNYTWSDFFIAEVLRSGSPNGASLLRNCAST